MKTVITHFYNEEYLLPFWLKHHKKYFDHGVLIDYHSTDRSVEICREICPDWEIVTSEQEEFSAVVNDVQVSKHEKRTTLDGDWRIVLNITEFLIGDFAYLDRHPRAASPVSGPSMVGAANFCAYEDHMDIIIPSFAMADSPFFENVDPDPSIPLIKQRCYGVPHPEAQTVDELSNRRGRRLSNFYTPYPTGRHYCFSQHEQSEKFRILWYGYSPMTDSLRKRIMQIRDKIPRSDKDAGMGVQHFIWDAKQVEERFKLFQKHSIDLTEIINSYENP